MKKLFSTTGLILGLALLIAVNLFADTALRSMRIDLTENKLYSLSEGTRRIVKGLDEPVTLRLYFSKSEASDFPQLLSYAERVEELLTEYVNESEGKISLEVIEPERFSEEEDRAVGFGLQGAAVNTAGDRLYFGLAGTNSVDDKETIPFFDNSREQFLEYDLTELVFNLTGQEKKVVGILSTLPVRGVTQDLRQRPQPWVFLMQMEKLFEVRHLQPQSTTDIDSEIDVLMIIHPKELSDETLFAIDQYALGGGRVLAFVDPFCEQDQSTGPDGNPMFANRSSEMARLFDAWGLELNTTKLAADRENALQTQWQGGVIDLVTFFAIREGGFSEDDFVTSELASVNFAMPGILTAKDGATTTFEPLLQTGVESMGVDITKVQFQPDPQALLDDFIPSTNRLAIAARITGPIKTAFPDGRPKAANGEEPESGEEESEPDALTESVGPINAIIVADVDFLHRNLWARVQNFLGSMMIQPLADNGDFIINALDNLCGSDDLISLRSRGQFQRPFEKKRELERAADEKFRAEEQELERKLEETEQKLAELSRGGEDGSALILSPEQEQAYSDFLEEKVQTRKDLRRVKHQLQKDIDSLGTRLKFVNILLIPLVILLGALALVAGRR